MVELIKYIVSQFVDNPDDVTYDVTETARETNVTITLSERDIGKVIGRQGKIAKALRTIVRAASQKENKKYNIEIKERGEKE